jgi:hypothetical protein
MIGLIGRALFLWRLWRVFKRSPYAQRLVRRAWDLHSQRWVARTRG